MAKPTESRVNKAFIIPNDQRPAIIVDPESVATGDHSYDDIENARVARYAGENPQVEQVDSGFGTQAEKSADLRDAMGGQGASTIETDSGLGTHAEKVADLQDAINAHDMPAIDTPVDDVSPGNYP